MDYKGLDVAIRQAIARMEAEYLEEQTITGYGHGKNITVIIKNKHKTYPENAEPIKDNTFSKK